MVYNEEGKIFNLEERTLEFSKRILRMVRVLPKTDVNRILINQSIRSATSVGANYREANDSLGYKDFIHRLKIARKEAKETIYWLELIMEENPKIIPRIKNLYDENIELNKILSKIIIKKEQSKTKK